MNKMAGIYRRIGRNQEKYERLAPELYTMIKRDLGLFQNDYQVLLVEWMSVD